MLGLSLGLGLNGGGSGGGAFTPLALNPVLWYDMEDQNRVKLELNSGILSNITYVTKVENKANIGTYNADKGASSGNLGHNFSQLNNNGSLINTGNRYMQTYYAPKMGVDGCISFALNIKTADTLSVRSHWGANDSLGHACYLRSDADGKIRVGMGNTSFVSSTSYPISTVLSIVARTRSVSGTKYLDVWINNVLEINNQVFTFSGTSSNTTLIHARTSSGSPTEYANSCYVGDIILVERSITDAELLNLKTFMALKSSDTKKLKIIVVAGQSNAQGINTQADYTDAAKEKPDFRIWQIAGVSSISNEGDITPAWEPLKHRAVDQSSVGLGFAIAKAYLATQTDPSIRVLIVPAARGDTGFSSGEWVRTTGSLYLNLIAKTNTALASGSNTELIFLAWQQGERDSTDGTTQVAYQNYFLDMMDGYRAGITGASNLKATVGEMVPNFVDTVIRAALTNLPSLDSKVGFVSSSGLSDRGDNLHFNGASARIMGQRHFNSYQTL